MISERLKALGGSQTSGMRNRARKLQAAGIKVVNFAAGELDLDTSHSIKQAVHQAIDARHTQYTDTLGIAALRELIALRMSKKTGLTYTSEEVGFTAGAKQALFNAAFAVFGPGDEVIIPAPFWVTFPEQVRLAGATPIFLPTTHNGFQIDPQELSGCITSRTKGIILNTPHNPTGAVYPAHILEQIARLVIQHDMVCIYDECYDEIVYAPARHDNIVRLVPEMKARTILIGSLSKSYCMAGWRAGFFAAPAMVVKAIANLQSHLASNPSNLAQYAAIAAFAPENDAFVAANLAQLASQRKAALAGLSKLEGLSCVIPEGAFYLFPDISALLDKSHQGQPIAQVDRLAEILLEHAHIAVVPGSAFGAERFIRMSYAIPTAEIVTGFEQLAKFQQELT